MNRKNQWAKLFLLFCSLSTSGLLAQENSLKTPYFYFGAALGNSYIAPNFDYGPAATALEPFRERQYMLRFFGGYAWHRQHSLELSLEAIPNHSGAQIPLPGPHISLLGPSGRLIKRSNSISLNLAYLWRAFQYGPLAFRLGPHLGVAGTLEDRGPGSISRISYPDFGSAMPYVELSAEMQRRFFFHLGGRARLELNLGAKKAFSLFLTGGMHYSPSTLQRYAVSYRPLDGPEMQSRVETNLYNWFLGLGFKQRLLRS